MTYFVLTSPFTVLSEAAATAAWVALPLVKLCLPGVLKASPDVLETASKRGMTQTGEDGNVHPSCIHGCL